MSEQVHITRHTSGKLAGIVSINTSPLTNEYCRFMAKQESSICEKCYARRLMGFRRNMSHRFEENGRLLSEAPLEQVPLFNERYVRFHSFGELINDQHLLNFIEIARANPHTTFSLLTKRVGLVHKYIDEVPHNVVLTFGDLWLDPLVLTPIPKGFDHSYGVYSTGEPCGKECLSCLKCYTKGVHMHIRQKLH